MRYKYTPTINLYRELMMKKTLIALLTSYFAFAVLPFFMAFELLYPSARSIAAISASWI